jgi:hypothetical protein
LLFPNVFLMIPSCSHQVPNGFFFMFPMFPIAAHFILYVLANFLFFVNHVGSPKGKTTLCLFWEWQKFAHHTYITRLCGQVLF